MTLRDLTPKKLEQLQKHCNGQYAEWSRNRNAPVVEDAWKQAWSNGLKAGLALIDVAIE